MMYEFPNLDSTYLDYIWIGIIVSIVAVLALLFTWKKKWNVLFIWSGFVLLFSLGTIGFSWWSLQKLQPVLVDAERIKTPYGEIALEDISQAEIILDKQGSKFGIVKDGQPVTVDSSEVLLIERKGENAPHVLSSDNYDIDSILQVLRLLAPKRD